MNGNSDRQERGKWDFVHFGIMFAGFLLGAAGIVTLSPCVTITAGVMLAYGLCYFGFQQWLRSDDE